MTDFDDDVEHDDGRLGKSWTVLVGDAEGWSGTDSPDESRDELLSCVCCKEYDGHVGACACVDDRDGAHVIVAAVTSQDGMGASSVYDVLSRGGHDMGSVDVHEMTKPFDYARSYVMRDGRFSGRGGMVSEGRQSGAMPKERRHDGSSVIAISLDTTGLDCSNDEIIGMSIYGDNGDSTYSRKFGTDHMTSWPDAERANGISPASLEGLPTVGAAWADDDDMRRVLSGSDVIIAHNLPFVLSFLASSGIDVSDKRFGDTQRCFNRYAMSRKLYRARGTLSCAAKTLKVQFASKPTAADKAKATYEVWLVLVRRNASETDDISGVRENYMRSNAYKRKKKASKAS